AADDAQRVRAGFHAPAPHRTRQHVVAGDRGYWRYRVAWMQVDRRAQDGGALPERIVAAVVEVFAVAVAVDHGAAELELAHAALELGGGGPGVLHGQMREAGIALRPFLHFLGQKIIRRARGPHRRGGAALGLHARSGHRQDRARDAGFVHHRQALLAEIGQRAVELRRFLRRDVHHGRVPVRFGGGIEEVLFERDLLDHRLPPRVFLLFPLYRILG